MTVVAGAAAVPAAPLLLPDASPAQPAEAAADVAALRRRVDQVLTSLPAADVVVLVAPGPRGFRERSRASLRPLGVPAADVALPVDRQLLTHATRLTQYPVLLGGDLEVEHTVLARLVHAVLGEVRVLPVSVAPGTDGKVLLNVGASLVEALRDVALTGLVVAATDLSAGLDETSPRYRIDGAPAWDEATARAFEAGDTDALADLGPAEAARVHAVGWAPLTVLAGVASSARLTLDGPATYEVVRGVGRLVGRLSRSGAGDVGGAFRREATASLSLPRDTDGR